MHGGTALARIGRGAVSVLAVFMALQELQIATDIVTGERVVYRDGSLTQAMRASMSVPGLLAPLDYRGRKLVDGGLVDNLPVREVRERCGADIVIAVNVGSPPLPADQVTGLLGITAQMVVLLTEQNVTASLATLREVTPLTAVEPDRKRITIDVEGVVPRVAARRV